MPTPKLEDVDYEIIKTHILQPEESPLSPVHQEQFDRVMSAARILDKDPIKTRAELKLRAKYGISKKQAGRDVDLASRLYNTIYKFDFDRWQSWTLNSIVRNIEQLRADGTPAARNVISREHANLIKALGDKVEKPNDPRLNEKHEFYIFLQYNNQQIKFDLDKLKDLPPTTLEEITRLLLAPQEITEDIATEIMDT